MKRGLMIILAFCLLSQLFFIGAATQSASSIVVNVDGTQRTIGDSTTYFIGSHTYAAASSVGAGQHDASQVWVSVQDGEMTLLQALQSTNKLKPNPSNPTTYSSSPSDKTKPYHFGTEITYASGSLQTAINAGTFVYVPVYTYSWVVGSWSSYSAVDACVAQKTRTVVCQRNDGVVVADSYCPTSFGSPKPETTSSCNHCRWVAGNYLAVWITVKYCSALEPANSCVASTLGAKHICKTSGANCFAAWCDGTTDTCTAFPISTYCS